MENLRRVLRLIGLGILIILACTGVGFLGGIPIHEKRRRQNIIELRTEIKKEDENKEGTVFFYKQE